MKDPDQVGDVINHCIAGLLLVGLIIFSACAIISSRPGGLKRIIEQVWEGAP